MTKEGLTILLTTHYLEEAEQLAGHVAIINKGEIVASGTMSEVLSMHDENTHPKDKDGYRGGRLEEVFLKLQGNHARTFPSWLPVFKLDRIYCRKLHIQEAKTFTDGVWSSLSDHTAIYAELCL